MCVCVFVCVCVGVVYSATKEIALMPNMSDGKCARRNCVKWRRILTEKWHTFGGQFRNKLVTENGTSALVHFISI